MKATRVQADRLARWWLCTLPALDGRLRFVVYALLFVLSWTHVAGILAGPDLVFSAPAYAYTPRGLAAVFLEGRPSSTWVMPLRALTALAWVAAAIGLCSRPAAILTACGALVLNGVTAGIVGSNHGWYLPVFTLFALVLARTDDRYSVDFHIRRWRGRPGRPAGHARAGNSGIDLGRTGFCRVLVLVVAVCILFMGGIAKLRASGFEWLDGRTVHAYIEPDRYPLLGEFLAQNSWACAVLSWFALTLELGAPLALLSRRGRHLLVVAATCFHIGIAAVMVPRYAQYGVCYLLLVDWEAVAAWISRRSSRGPEAPEPSPQALASPVARISTAAGMLLVGCIAVVTVLRIEWWPLTHVPMYSSYVSKKRVGEVRKADLHDSKAAARIAQDCLAAPSCAWALPLAFARHVRVRVVSQGKSRKLGGDVPPSQWKHLVGDVAMRQLSIAAVVGYGPDAPPTDGGPVDTFLHTLVPELRAQLPPGVHGHVVFEYKVRGGFYTMGHLPL